ncbi:MAG: transporter [Bacteroidetes bacterium]|nr:MAG: transporter [Bacteroidota bacterium]
MNRIAFTQICALCFSINLSIHAQNKNDSLLQEASLKNCVDYALTHQPSVQQSLIDSAITERTIKSKLADWYPQLNLNYNYQHFFQLPKSIFQGNIITTGLDNTSYAQFGLTQTIFDRDVLFASKSAKDVRIQARQNIVNDKIDVAVIVSKAFYDVLLTQKQIEILDDDIVLLQRSLKDAENQYKGGLVDKIDFKRATISLNNALASKRQNEEQLKAKYAFLKEQMGYPPSGHLNLIYDSTQMFSAVFLDTTQKVNMENRIEYQILQTRKRLLEENVKYNKWSFIPSVSAYGNYNFNWFNNDFSKLYSQNFPTSFAGLSLSFPIFQGTKRSQEIKQAQLQLDRADYDVIALRNTINTEFEEAMATYKSNVSNYIILKENLDLSEEVYNTVQLQYRAGVKTYLDVIVSQTDLRTSQVTYINALYQVLSSKLDVERALGSIKY